MQITHDQITRWLGSKQKNFGLIYFAIHCLRHLLHLQTASNFNHIYQEGSNLFD